MSERIQCCVPFCNRTAARLQYPDAEEIICGKHYRLASAVLRRRLTKVRRRKNHLFRIQCDWPAIMRLDAIDNELWRRIKRQAIELAVGL